MRTKPITFKIRLARIRHIAQLLLCNQIPVRYCKSLNFPHPVGIVIGSEAKIANGVTIFQNVTIGRSYKAGKVNYADDYPTINKGVVILANAVVAGNITIGSNCVIGACAVITKDIPPNSLAVGHNIIKKLR